ncbi:hypothetical protein IFM89_033134 [Coptis chinensis]|uniref:Uncharacterized protein n=1 Tax=Coptis chinensis TaxID=261450 RepID=A0A835HFS2_9MAGN|nr:hypothetical protein IFM89_033134 [Coptis chinensis]
MRWKILIARMRIEKDHLTLPDRNFIEYGKNASTSSFPSPELQTKSRDTVAFNLLRLVNQHHIWGVGFKRKRATNEKEHSFSRQLTGGNDIRNWIRNIEQHASDNVNKILVGNKADMDESKRVVPTSRGQVLADEYGIKFFETGHKTKTSQTIKISKPNPGKGSSTVTERQLAVVPKVVQSIMIVLEILECIL